MDTIISSLEKISYFSECDEHLKGELVQYARLVTYESGQVITLEGDPSDAICVVASGWLKSSKASPNGREHVLRWIGPGETFNEVSALTAGTNPTTITALERAVLCVIPRDNILSLLDQHPALARVIVKKLAGTVQFLLTVVEDLSLRSIEARLARYLIEQAAGHRLHRPKWATQAEIANHLGTVPNVLNRSLKNLEKEGLVSVERHQIKILNLPGLTERAALDK